MNRIIKFRCWINNEMWYDFWLSNDEHEGVLLYDDNLNSPPVKCNKPYILMQFTGLYDKNGKEVFEGDIVQIYKHMSSEKSEVTQVIWDEENCEYKGIYPNIAIWVAHEVIGNIYQDSHIMDSVVK